MKVFVALFVAFLLILATLQADAKAVRMGNKVMINRHLLREPTSLSQKANPGATEVKKSSISDQTKTKSSHIDDDDDDGDDDDGDGDDYGDDGDGDDYGDDGDDGGGGVVANQNYHNHGKTASGTETRHHITTEHNPNRN
ncbi:hypothetical protein P3X46_005846 [Hevea brasiliensis]|uniref:Uncharacterized protein n=2 Tax=Hevea brasiliensis TaxID=3981 RepID=A0ABQ9MPB0_HEVBR|nr:hypothetical protein P3X46_005846 [Hevea brasiliensis]